jgi:hypothetical protein
MEKNEKMVYYTDRKNIFKMKMKWNWVVPIVLVAAGFFSASFCLAQMSSGNFKIDADSLNSGGAPSSSALYALNDTVGEIATGVGASGTYKLEAGFWHMVNTYLTLSVDTNVKDLGSLLPGSPITGQTTIDVTTDAWNGYSLSAVKNHKMLHSDATTTIDNHSGTVVSPLLWSDPDNLGFGFTLVSGTEIESKWGSSPNFKYAGFPDASAEIHAKEGFKSEADETVVGYKVNVQNDQKSGAYSCMITYTAVGSI